MNSIGLFGGTFNPLHLGHLQVAEEVKAGFGLGKIIFIPSAIPPHKGISGLADARDRYKMIVGAVTSKEGFEVSDVEIQRRGPSYTIDTVTYFKNKVSPDTACYLIVGLDAFLEIDTWKTYQDLFDRIPFIVMTRPTENDRQPAEAQTALETYIKKHVDQSYRYSHHQSCFSHHSKQPIHLFGVTPIDISSSKIRALIKKGAPVKHLIPDTVDAYIQKKGLYV